MRSEEIDDTICEIMYQDGPDRHVDGHEILLEFVLALLAGEGEAWRAGYAKNRAPTKFI